ncbi:MAG: TIGR00266 family protein [Lentisphaeria bacterium]|nr:TIGR00266 family protein [Lentisphaeria bacterium]
MNTTIECGPGCSTAHVAMAPGETCTSEAGAMIAMSGDMGIETTTKKRGGGGVLKAMKRMLAGESFFLNHFTAGQQGGELYLATTMPGDMMTYQLQAGESLIVQGGSYVACEEGVEIDLSWQGFKSFLSGERVFWLNLNGEGQVILSSFGAIYPIEIDGEHIVDTGHIVAFNETLDFTLTKAGKSWASSFLGGEGLVCKFRGRGTVWCQSHNAVGFGRTLGAKLRPR